MQLTDFTNCCNAKILYDFGETDLSACGQDIDRHMETHLDEAIQYHRRMLLVAITSNEQTTINGLLRSKGFKHSSWMGKNQHPETQIRLWWRKPDYDRRLSRYWHHM